MSVWTSVPGQERALAQLEADVAAGRVAHAYLFTGPAGSTLRDAALAFSAALVCERDGCGECDACRRVARHVHPDVEIVEPPGMQLLVDQVREATRAAWRKPVAARRRVIVIDQADRMNPNAQNAFLKALEEPPASAVIVLVAPGIEALLETVRSRCREVVFRPLSRSQVAQALKGTGVAELDAERWARVAGSFDRALQLATDEEARARRTQVAERLLRPSRDPGDALESAEWLAGQTRVVRDRVADAQKAEAEEHADWFRESKTAADARMRREQRRAEQDALSATMDDLTSLLRDLLASLFGGSEQLVNGDLEGLVSARAEQVGPARVGAVLEALGDVEQARRRLRSNANVLLTLEALFLSLQSRFERT